MRVAFLTPEFVTEYPDGGGLGHYIDRVTRALVDAGHEAEVFVPGDAQPAVLDVEGVRVERVARPRGSAARVSQRLARVVKAGEVVRLMGQSGVLVKAMERRHRERPFDVVQSADYQAVGWRMRRAAGRPHLVRCSTASHVYDSQYANRSLEVTWRRWLEHAAVRRADRAYAPSRYLAEALHEKAGLVLDVVRPPAALRVRSEAPCVTLPDRFLVYFGQFLRRKGTAWLADALVEALRREPAIRMIWIGHDSCGELSAILDRLKAARDCVAFIAPMPAPQLHAIVARAEAAVLPSLVDNLPNTVIESLLLGVPVIGTRGASIDELVDPGVNGLLVEAGDVGGLAEAMVDVWRGRTTVRKGFTWPAGTRADMEPGRAVAALVELAARAGARL